MNKNSKIIIKTREKKKCYFDREEENKVHGMSSFLLKMYFC